MRPSLSGPGGVNVMEVYRLRTSLRCRSTTRTRNQEGVPRAVDRDEQQMGKVVFSIRPITKHCPDQQCVIKGTPTRVS